MLGPPVPCPPFLRPYWGALGPGDLRVALSTEELRALARLLDVEKLAGQTMVTQRDGSPWVEIAVAVPYHVTPPDRPDGEPAVGGRTYKYAMWRYTCAIHRVGDDGAVQGEPVVPGQR